MSRSMALSSFYGSACRTCGAGKDQPCRTRSGKVTSAHMARAKAGAVYRKTRRHQKRTRLLRWLA